MRYSIVIATLVMLAPSILLSATIYVPDDYPKIVDAICHASHGDTILVKPGTYLENLDFRGKAVKVASTKGPAATVIDGSQVRSVVRFENGEGKDSVLEGFTIINGAGEYGMYGYAWGGGICCRESSPAIIGNVITKNKGSLGGGIAAGFHASPAIIGNVISDNEAKKYGGGIGCHWDSHAVITKNVITGNSGYSGGGIYATDCGGEIRDNTIQGNSVFAHGGGIHCHSKCSALIAENLIQANAAGRGGGILSDYDSDPLILRNRVLGNTVTNWGGGIMLEWHSLGRVRANFISGNHAVIGGGLAFLEFTPTSSDMAAAGNMVCGNHAEQGGGILAYTAEPLLLNNTVLGNTAVKQGGALWCAFGADVSVVNSIFWQNDAPEGPELWIGDSGYPSILTISHSDVQGGQSQVFVYHLSTLNWGPGMIDADPLFVDALDGDFHLTCPSPCKEAGDPAAPGLPAEDFEGDPRTAYGTPDMGADEFYTHLYWTGNPTPKGNVEIRIVGLPGTTPVGLCIGSGVLDPPIPSMWGHWYLQFPILGPIGLPPVPASGISGFSGTVPSFPPPPYTVPMQALVGNALTNLSVMNVQ